MTCPPNVRAELARLCERSGTRSHAFTRDAPTRWTPEWVVDPNGGRPFTEDGAWRHIRQLIIDGTEISPVELVKPVGKMGWVLRFKDARQADVYVKLQIISGKVIGRSFHFG